MRPILGDLCRLGGERSLSMRWKSRGVFVLGGLRLGGMSFGWGLHACLIYRFFP